MRKCIHAITHAGKNLNRTKIVQVARTKIVPPKNTTGDQVARTKIVPLKDTAGGPPKNTAGDPQIYQITRFRR